METDSNSIDSFDSLSPETPTVDSETHYVQLALEVGDNPKDQQWFTEVVQIWRSLLGTQPMFCHQLYPFVSLLLNPTYIRIFIVLRLYPTQPWRARPRPQLPAQFRFPSPTWDARLGCPAGTYADGVLQVPTQCTPCPEGRRTSGKRRSGIGWVNFMVGSMVKGLTIQKWIKMVGYAWGYMGILFILWHIISF